MAFPSGGSNEDPGLASGAGAQGTADAAAEETDFATRYANLLGELARRLEAELGATGVAFTSPLPSHEPVVRIEIEGDVPSAGTEAGDASALQTAATHGTRHVQVEPGFFDALEIMQLEGRRLGLVDAVSGASAVLVNRSFVDRVLSGRSATGRRIRYVGGYRSGGVERFPAGAEAESWYEIVGVVDDFPPRPTAPGGTEARVYHAVAPGHLFPAGLVVRMPTDVPAGAIQRTRDIAASVDPALRFTRLATLDAPASAPAMNGMLVGTQK